jgi:hypothetical protein
MNPARFEVALTFTNSETNENVVFKVDGARFTTADKTIKFCSNDRYKITVVTRPAREFL